MKERRILRLTILCTCLLKFATLAFAAPPQQQAPTPEFDAVSIRPAETTQIITFLGVSAVVSAPWKACEYLRDRVQCRLPLWNLIREAFQVQDFELKAPAWTKEDRFQVQATMPLDTPRQTARLMLQTALKEQFSLQYHRDTRVTPVYALVVAEGGAKLTEYDPEHPQTRTYDTPRGPMSTTMILHAGRYFYAHISLDIVAKSLETFAGLNRPVVNETGLTGTYVIDMTWKTSADPDEVVNPVDPAVLRAMEQQLGLKLVKKDEPREYLSVDHVNPTPNDL